MIELPSGPAVIEERLAALADPVLAERLVRENPDLFSPEPPRTQREILRWTTRRVGTAIIAVTAAVSIVAGYFGSELTRHPAPVATHRATAAAVVPHAHPRPAAHHAARHVPLHVARHAAPAIVHHAAPPAAAVSVVPHMIHVAPAVQPRPDREAQLLRARLHARDLELARLRAEAIAARAAARAAQARAAASARVATSPATAPQTRPQSEPASAVDTATATGRAGEPDTGRASGPASGTAPEPGAGRSAPTNPGGVWNGRIPRGTLGGTIGPILVGVPRDSCTPQGGRVGAVTRVIEAVQIIQGLSRH